MYEYEYVTVVGEGIMTTKYQEHREIIDRRAAEGWRYAGYVPVKVNSYGVPAQIDLIFEREV